MLKKLDVEGVDITTSKHCTNLSAFKCYETSQKKKKISC